MSSLTGRSSSGHLADEAQRLAAHLVVEDELRQAEDQQEVEHPGTGHRVDAGERCDQRAAEGLGTGLGVEDLPVGRAMYHWVGRPRDLATATYAASSWSASIADIGELAIFMWNVAGAPPNRTGAPGRMTWAIVMPGQHIGGMEDRRAHDRDRRDQAHQRDRHDLDRDPASTQSIRFWQESSL